jgi:hypothetical protein
MNASILVQFGNSVRRLTIVAALCATLFICPNRAQAQVDVENKTGQPTIRTWEGTILQGPQRGGSAATTLGTLAQAGTLTIPLAGWQAEGGYGHPGNTSASYVFPPGTTIDNLALIRERPKLRRPVQAPEAADQAAQRQDEPLLVAQAERRGGEDRRADHRLQLVEFGLQGRDLPPQREDELPARVGAIVFGALRFDNALPMHRVGLGSDSPGLVESSPFQKRTPAGRNRRGQLEGGRHRLT